mmetsp:Transcript_188/g.795  ORF Transcript_188/g.795 Transcript_188/m.795 type:complete len:495 (+) Transcript_188:1417-2901(+)
MPHASYVLYTSQSETSCSVGRCRLHRGELLQEVGRHAGQGVENLHGSLPDAGLVVGHALLLAERGDDLVHLGQVVTRDGGEEVVLHLELQSTAEPVHERAARDVARGRDLQLPEVRARTRLVHGHAVVPKAEDNGQQEAAGARRNEEEQNGPREGASGQAQGRDPGVVHKKSSTLEVGIGHELLREVEVLGVPGQRVREHEGERALEPGQASEPEDREVADGLVLHEPLGQLRVRGLGHAEGPRQQGHRVDIRITIGRIRLGLVEVGDGVVLVVLVLPPGHVEALPDVADHDAREVAEAAVLEHLVVEEIVGEPAALLPEDREHDSGKHVHQEAVRGQHHRPGESAQGQRREALPRVVQPRGLEQAGLLQLDTQVAVRLLELRLRIGLLQIRRAARHVHFSDEVLLHGLVGRGRMEGSEHIRHVISRMAEDDQSARVLHVVAHVIDLVPVDHPGILGGAVAAYFVPRELLQQPALQGRADGSGFSAFSHSAQLR